MKLYLVKGEHAWVPGTRQLATFDKAAADEFAAGLVTIMQTDVAEHREEDAGELQPVAPDAWLQSLMTVQTWRFMSLCDVDYEAARKTVEEDAGEAGKETGFDVWIEELDVEMPEGTKPADVQALIDMAERCASAIEDRIAPDVAGLRAEALRKCIADIRPAQMSASGNYILKQIVDRGFDDMYTDAPEYEDRVLAFQNLLAEASAYLDGAPPPPVRRVWYGSFDGKCGTILNAEFSERALEDWMMEQVGEDRESFNEWLSEQDNDDKPGVDDFLCEHCDHLDSWTWETVDVPVPGLGQRPRVVVALEGGLVGGASSDVPMDMVVIDYDIDDAGEDEVVLIPQSAKDDTEEALVHEETVAVDPEWTNAIFDIEKDEWGVGHKDAGYAGAATTTIAPGLKIETTPGVDTPANLENAVMIIPSVDALRAIAHEGATFEAGCFGDDDSQVTDNDPAAVVAAGLDLLDMVPWTIIEGPTSVRFLALDNETDEPRIFRAVITKETV